MEPHYKFKINMYWSYFWCPFPASTVAFPASPVNENEKPKEQPNEGPEIGSNPPEEKNEKENDVFTEELKKHLRKKHSRPQKKTWTPVEDEKLLSLKEKGLSWMEISGEYESTYHKPSI